MTGCDQRRGIFRRWIIPAFVLMALSSGRSGLDFGSPPPIQSDGYQYPPDFQFVEVPNPLAAVNPRCLEAALPFPKIGRFWREECYGGRVRRVTQPDGIRGRHEYSRFDPFNCNGTMIVLLTDSGDYAVYRTASCPFNQAANFVCLTNGIEDPRWDASDPDLLWGLSGFRIVRDWVSEGRREVVKDFSNDARIQPLLAGEPDLYRVTMFQEGEASHNRRFWALLLQGTKGDYRPRYLFCWDRQSDRVVGIRRLAQAESNIDWVGMSVKGNWVLVGGMHDNGGSFCGLTMANRELTRFHRLDYTTAHADVGLDSQGAEVVVMQNVQTDYIDMLPLDFSTLPILQPGGSYRGTHRVKLVRLFYSSSSPSGLQSGVHISGNVPGYCVVSTNIGAGVAERNWLDRAIVLVRLDASHPRAFYLSKIYTTTATYFEETHAAISSNGSRIVWAANWNRNVGQDDLFLLQFAMPPHWRGLTSAAIPRPGGISNAEANIP